jgi:hypothetical protein
VFDFGFNNTRRIRTSIPLEYHDELINSMHVMRLNPDEVDPEEKGTLIASSPIKANEIYATVNDYHEHFNQVNPAGISHLLTLHIKDANLKQILAPIGRVVRKAQATGVEHH